jgi:D-sedoheptulose 7-phosphate isomerase
MMQIDTYLANLGSTLAATPREPLQAIEDALWATYQRDGTILICGNGGSAATATHFACDLAKWTICAGKRRLRALALTDNAALMTAWSNDTAYERVFVEQLISCFRPGDTLVAISGSGNSPSVLRATEWANTQGAATIALTGFGGGTLATLASIAHIAPSQFMPEVEDVHSAICHGLAVALAERMHH